MSKLYGFRKYILILIFLLNGNLIYFTSSAPNKADLFFNFLIFLAGIGIVGSVGSKAVDKIKKEDEP
jgi:hypothetical protein